MVFETTYTDKEVTKEINQLVGLPFNFRQRLKLGGIGSHRIAIEEVSEGLKPYVNTGFSVKHVNIELRPLGIILHLKMRTQTYAWVISFTKLKYDDDFTTISDNTHAITLKDAFAFNKSFFKKLVDLNEKD